MLSLEFSITMAMRGHLKIAKNHYFALIFSIKTYFQSAATSQRIEIESKAFQPWLQVTVGSIWDHFYPLKSPKFSWR
jgi:hypothetical protein